MRAKAHKPKPKTKSRRAKGRKPACERTYPDRLTRVQFIVGLMAADDWSAGESTHKLATQWGLSISEVVLNAAEASRQIKTIVAGDPELSERLRIGLDWAAAEAKRVAKKYASKPNIVLNALRSYNESLRVLTAAQTRTNAQHAMNRGEPSAFADKTDEELASELRGQS